MSLQVWLPLTKDLRQQGLNSATIEEVTSAVFDNSGKLGKCLSEGKIKIPANQVASIFNNTSMSIAFWYNNNTSETTGNHAICGFSGNGEGDTDAVRIWDFFNYANPNTFHWSMGTLGGGSLSNIFPANTWVHVCVTWNAPTLKIYMDGVLKYTGSGSSNYTFDKSYYISFGRTPQKLNDFRIYDHCLSPMEVKELSKGLVLHYPLNRGGWGQENLLPVSGSTIIDSTQSFEFQGWVQNFYTKTWMNEHLTPGKQYTLSYTATCLSIPDSTYTFKERRHSPILVHQGGGWSQITTTSDGIKDTNMSVGQSRDYRCTFTFATVTENYEYYGLCGYTALYRNSSNNAQYAKFRIDNLKLEEGSIATPWCPNSSDTLATTIGLNSTTEYDCSGFCNNGTRTGTFTWTSDTPKYSVSQYFNGSSYILTNSGTFSWFNFDKCTVAVWMKPTTTPSSWAGTFGIAHNNSSSNKSFVVGNYGGKFTMQSANGNWVNVQASNLPINEWHHCVATLDGTTIKMYFDGELVNTYTINWGNTTVASDTRVQVGNDLPGSDEIYVGYYSDARIYATALSASDVKSLYQNCATIDPDGTIRGKIRS